MGRDRVLSAAGAISEGGVVAHFGDPAAEWSAAQTAAGLFDRGHRDRLALDGPDAAPFLNRLLSYNIVAMAPGSGARPFLLDATGRIQAAFHLFRLDEETFRADCTPGHSASILEQLDRFHFGERLEMSALDGQAALAVQGPTAAEVLRRAHLAVPQAPWAHLPGVVGGATVRVARVDLCAGPGFEVHFADDDYAAVFEALAGAGAHPAGDLTLERLRVQAGRAKHPNELGPHSGPIEAGADDGYSEGKGCYPGQEVIERTLAIGKPARLPLSLTLDGSAAVGQVLQRDGRDAGTLTSVVVLPDGRVLALALVKRRHATAEATFQCGPEVTARARTP